MKIGFLHSLIRKDEKFLLEELNKRPHIQVKMLDDRKMIFNLATAHQYDVDAILERCISHSRAIHALQVFSAARIPCFNTPQVAETCGSKFTTSLALQTHKVPQPQVRIAFTENSALQAIEEIGYPVVLKPTVGSWGRLITRVNDRHAAEAVLEHKTVLGTYHHSIFYIQQYIEKKGRDIRSFVVGDQCIAAIYRESDHWITNTAKGAKTSNCPVTPQISQISLAAAKAVGGGILAVDLLETDNGLLVNEVNYTMEFKNSIEPTGINIPAKIIDYVTNTLAQAK